MATQELKIQDDYWTGTDCLKNEIPWVVPGAVHKLDRLVMPSDAVLDIGSGGSTLFYAKRCRMVTAVETNPTWFKTVSAVIEAQGITNIDYYLAQRQEEVEEILKTMGWFDTVSVDSVHGYSRSRFLNIVAPRCRNVLVLDNYAAPELFDTHHDKEIGEIVSLLPEGKWEGEDFNDEHWCGKGTRIIHRSLV